MAWRCYASAKVYRTPGSPSVNMLPRTERGVMLSRMVGSVTGMYPYPLDLTQLEGFDPTPNEIKVAESPSFQYLRRHGRPNWGEAGTNLSFEPRNRNDDYATDKFDVLGSPMSPTQVDNWCQTAFDHLRKVTFLTAQICCKLDIGQTGVADGALDERDRRLIFDLRRWLGYTGINGKWWESFGGFRWEIHHESLVSRCKDNDWQLEVEAFKQGGTFSVVVLLMPDLSSDVQEKIRLSLLSKVEAEKPPLFGGEHVGHWSDLVPYMHRTECSSCGSHGNGREDCKNLGAIPLVDCGDVAEVKSWIEPRYRRQVQAVRFEVPRSLGIAFSRSERALALPMLIFDVSKLNTKQRADVHSTLSDWIKQEQDRESSPVWRNQGEFWRASEVFRPSGKQQMRAIILAGFAAHGRLLVKSWREAFSQHEEVYNLVKDGMVVTHAYKP